MISPRHATCLAVALAACGSTATFPDGAPGDAAADAQVSGTITVNVHVRTLDFDGKPDPTALVFFAGPDGAVSGQANPDANGDLSHTLPAGGSVTVRWDVFPERLMTVAAVEDGDDLTFGYPDDAVDQHVTVSVPAFAGATGYTVRGPCLFGQSTTTTVDVSFSRPCGATHSAVAIAYHASGRSYLVAPSVTPTAGGNLTLTGAWQAAESATVAVSGVPAGATAVDIGRVVYDAGAIAESDYASAQAVTGGAASHTFATPPGYGQFASIRVVYADPAPYALMLYRVGLTEAGPIEVAPIVPSFTAAARTPTEVTWALAGSGGDAVVLDLVDLGGKGEVRAEWRVIAPASATAARVPVLPSPVAALGAELDSARVVESSATASYAAFRPEAGTGLWIDREPMPAPADTVFATRFR